MHAKAQVVKSQVSSLSTKCCMAVKPKLERRLRRQALSISPRQDLPEVAALLARVDVYLFRRNKQFVQGVFDRHADPGTKDPSARLLSAHKLQAALSEFGVQLTASEASKLAVAMDTEDNGGLNLEEFVQALNQPPTQVEQFVDTLPLTGMLAACLSDPGSDDPLKALCNIKHDSLDLTSRIEAFKLSLHKVLQSELVKLLEMVDAMEEERDDRAGNAGSKFAAGMVEMNAGTTEEFHRGVQGRVGGHTCRAPAALQRPSIFFLVYGADWRGGQERATLSLRRGSCSSTWRRRAASRRSRRATTG